MGRSNEGVGLRTLEEFLDKRICVLLRDGKYVAGALRSFDQYHNLLIEDVQEWVFHGDEYGERATDVSVVRGENIVFLGDLLQECRPLHARNEYEAVESKREEEEKIVEDLDFISL